MSRTGPARERERMLSLAQSLAAEAAGMTRKLPGVRVVVAVYTETSAAVRHVLEPEDAADWDAVSARLAGIAEEIRDQQRGAR